jgi:hypothetical protein
MKDFNLKDALAGKPVVTRDGRPVKIAGYNEGAKESQRIAAWLDGFIIDYGENGKRYSYTDYDLFMAPSERKEWVVRTPVLVDMLVNGNHYSNNIFGPYDNYETAMKTADSLKGSIHEITIHE